MWNLIPGLVGIIGSLFGGKGKQTQYANQLTPAQQQMYSKLLSMVGSRMGQPSAGTQPTSDALNLLYSKFFGRPYVQQTRNQLASVPGGGMPGMAQNPYAIAQNINPNQVRP
jgi:hypothetical protein